MTQSARTLDDLHPMLEASRVVPVVTVRDADQGVEIARALLRGGIRAIEITLRTDAAYDAIRAVKREVPEIALGVGTVLHRNHVEFCHEERVDFLVTPGTTDALYSAVAEHQLNLFPGVATASEALRALGEGCQLQKFFPAAASGGPAAISGIGGPMPDITFMPTGGIDAQTAPDYLALANVACVGGSWVTKPDDMDRVEELAREASRL